MKNESRAQATLDRVLAMVSAPEAQASYHASARLDTRFGENAITQNMGSCGEAVWLYVAYGRQHGSSVTNKLDGASLSELVRRTQNIARAAPEDPECLPLLGPQVYPSVPQRYFDDAACLTPDDLATGVKHVVEMAQSSRYVASGLYHTGHTTTALANNRGLFAADASSDVSFSVTMHGPNGSASACAERNSASEVVPTELAERALSAATAAQKPGDIEPGDYTVILEPEAAADFLGFVFWSMDARNAEEGSTAFAGKVGTKLFSDKVTLSTEINAPELPASPYGEDGLPARRTVWIRDGVVERLCHSRYWAQQKQTAPDPVRYPLFMRGEDRTTDELVSRCQRGLLVRRLWYIRYVDQKELLLTGMTRDGLFLVENGEVVGPVTNLRFNESPIVFLQNVVAMSRPQRVGSVMMPGIMSAGFTFSSKTESV